jgi:hypothetical protein
MVVGLKGGHQGTMLESQRSCLRRPLVCGRACEHGKGSDSQWGMRVGEVTILMDLLPKSAVMVSQRPPLWRSNRERKRCKARLCRSCWSPGIEGQILPAICPLLVKYPYMEQRRVGLCD